MNLSLVDRGTLALNITAISSIAFTKSTILFLSFHTLDSIARIVSIVHSISGSCVNVHTTTYDLLYSNF